MILKKWEVLSGRILSYIFTKVMHRFDSGLSCRDMKNWSKTAELLLKEFKHINSHCVKDGLDINFAQQQAGNFWRRYWFASFCRWKMGMAHDTVQMEFLNVQIVWIKRCRFDNIYSLTSLYSQRSLACHLYNVYIDHLPLNTMNDARVNL